MRKLKGAVKETRKQKQERRKENAQTQQQFHTIVLPVLGVIALLIFAYVFVKSRPAVGAPIDGDDGL